MILFVDESKTPNRNNLVLHADLSFGAAVSDLNFDYQVSLDDLGKIALNFNLATGKCLSVEGYSTGGYVEFQKRTIDVGEAKACGLMMTLSDGDPTEWGMAFMLPLKGRYIDVENRRMLFGTPNSRSAIYRFGCGQYVYCNGSQIEAILIEFSVIE